MILQINPLPSGKLLDSTGRREFFFNADSKPQVRCGNQEDKITGDHAIFIKLSHLCGVVIVWAHPLEVCAAYRVGRSNTFF